MNGLDVMRGCPPAGAPNRAMMSQLRSMAQLSMCARECKMATRDSGDPPFPRRGALLGSTRFTRSSLRARTVTRWVARRGVGWD